MINPATALCMLQDFEKLNAGDVIIQNAANCEAGIALVSHSFLLTLGAHALHSCRWSSSRPDRSSQTGCRDDQSRARPVRLSFSPSLFFLPHSHHHPQAELRSSPRALLQVGQRRSGNTRVQLRCTSGSHEWCKAGDPGLAQGAPSAARDQCAVRKGYRQYG